MNRMLPAIALVALAGASGCDNGSDEATAAKEPSKAGTVLEVSDTSTPGDWSFDKKKLTAKAGEVTIVLHNTSGLGHNLRVHTGKCCFKPGYKDLGGTEVVGSTSSDARKSVKATLDLEPGTYTFLCSIPGHFQAGQR